MLIGVVLMNLGGYIIGLQLIAAMNAAPYVPHDVPMLALALLWQVEGTQRVFAASHATAIDVGDRDVGCGRMARRSGSVAATVPGWPVASGTPGDVPILRGWAHRPG